jgi:hypothetical protein
MPNPIVFFEILGKDKTVLDDFYRAVFDWQLTPGERPSDYTNVNAGGKIPGGLGVSMDGGAGQVTFYVEVNEIAETVSLVESRGGRRLSGPTRLQDGREVALIADPEGHVIGLLQSGVPSNPQQIP